MSIIISAPLGSGKTLYAMSVIDKETKKNPNRLIYTNIVGCKYPGVILIKSNPDQPFDWRDLPNGALLIYDEAHEHPAFSKDDLLKTFQIDDSDYIKKIATINIDQNLKVKEKEELIRQEKKKQEFKLIKAKDDILDIGRSLTMHRHFGIEIYFITQKPFKLNEAVKASVVEHLILRRLFNLDFATIYSFAELQEQFGNSTMKNALSWRIWRFPKYLYKFYVSAETHNKPKKIPATLWFFPLLALLVIGSAIKDTTNSPMLMGVLGFFGFDTKKSTTGEQQANAKQTVSTQTDQQAIQQQKQENQIDCNDLNNSHLEQCIAYNREKQNRLNQQISENYAINYDPNNPYAVQQNIQYAATAKPVFSGCIKYNGKYQAYTQQGTKLNVSQQDCKNLIENGDRPFNYFASQNTHENTISSNTNVSNNTNLPVVHSENQMNYANNYVEPHLQQNSQVINGANAL